MYGIWMTVSAAVKYKRIQKAHTFEKSLTILFWHGGKNLQLLVPLKPPQFIYTIPPLSYHRLLRIAILPFTPSNDHLVCLRRTERILLGILGRLEAENPVRVLVVLKAP